MKSKRLNWELFFSYCWEEELRHKQREQRMRDYMIEFAHTYLWMMKDKE